MLEYEFRSLAAWPHPSTPDYKRRGHSTFKAAWSDTLYKLADEIEKAKGSNIVISSLHQPHEIRKDGMIRGGARTPQHPGIEVSFEVIGSDPISMRGRQLIRRYGSRESALKATHPDTRDPGSDLTDQDYIAVVKAGERGRAVFATDICAYWQHNVRSIALTLEALRAVDRYGAAQGRQYHGFTAALNAGPTN